MTHRMANRVKRLDECNGAPLPILTKSVSDLSNRVAGHLKAMGSEWLR
ncbi:hypothetical protein L1285_16470 [Pseudoalteromonas sp. DL2-H2.2]|nr:hypothetical protein [Pseudoalteromonas sp. DL2-H2.2]MCF2909920.1 hypothetical protein [Pseudoalteromonas sp. DL2-H2.2]